MRSVPVLAAIVTLSTSLLFSQKPATHIEDVAPKDMEERAKKAMQAA